VTVTEETQMTVTGTETDHLLHQEMIIEVEVVVGTDMTEVIRIIIANRKEIHIGKTEITNKTKEETGLHQEVEIMKEGMVTTTEI
jgi:hypothetical protein